MDNVKNRKPKKQEDNSTEHDIYIHHERTFINIISILLFFIAIATTLYHNMDNIQTTLASSKSRPYKKRTINQSIENNFISSHVETATQYSTRSVTTDIFNSTASDDGNGKSDNKITHRKSTKKDSLTNVYDKKILREISEGELYCKQKQYPECISFFEKLYKKYPSSPRAVYGQAKCLQKLAEEMKSNELLKKSIIAYGEVAKQKNVPPSLLKLSLIAQAKHYMFLGKRSRAILVLKDLSKQIPKDIEILNELGISYLTMGANEQALNVFEEALQVDPADGTAMVHYGFALKMLKQNEKCISYLLNGIRSKTPGTSNANFYYHLGDAYVRTGQKSEAWKIYNEAAEKGFFLSAEQRSIYNAETPLRAQPWWEVQETGYEKDIRLLEYHWKTIRDEALEVLQHNRNKFPLEAESLIQKGDRRQFELFKQGNKIEKNCNFVPKTCTLLEKMADATTNRRGQIKYSIMMPGTHVWPHTGPTNCRLRVHLGLNVPKDVYIRVGSETRTWKNGKAIIIDDSFDHEVWHNGTKERLILIVDFWHPDLPQWERNTLSAI